MTTTLQDYVKKLELLKEIEKYLELLRVRGYTLDKEDAFSELKKIYELFDSFE